MWSEMNCGWLPRWRYVPGPTLRDMLAYLRPVLGYDTLVLRRFAFVLLWHLLVIFLYAMRRVEC